MSAYKAPDKVNLGTLRLNSSLVCALELALSEPDHPCFTAQVGDALKFFQIMRNEGVIKRNGFSLLPRGNTI